MTATLHLNEGDRFERIESFDGSVPCFYLGLTDGSSVTLAISWRTLASAKRLRDELSAGIASLESHLASSAGGAATGGS